MRRQTRGIRHVAHTHGHTHFSRTKQPGLIITGDREEHNYKIWLQGVEVGLTGGLFSALCDLVCARLRTRTGYLPVSRKTISRLRARIERATAEPGRGRTLIQSGPGEEFRLTLEPRQIQFAPSFRELSAPKHLAEELRDQIMRNCRELTESRSRSGRAPHRSAARK